MCPGRRGKAIGEERQAGPAVNAGHERHPTDGPAARALPEAVR